MMQCRSKSSKIPSKTRQGGVKPLFMKKSWKKPSSFFISSSKRIFNKDSNEHKVVSYLKNRQVTSFNTKKRPCSSASFMSTTPRKGALENNTIKYPKVPISYIKIKTKTQRKRPSSSFLNNTMRLYERLSRAKTMPSGMIHGKKEKGTLFKRHHSTSYVDYLMQDRVKHDGSIESRMLTNKRRPSSSFISRTQRNSHVPKDQTEHSKSFYIPRYWKTKKSIVPFFSSSGRYTYLDSKTRNHEKNGNDFGNLTPYHKYSSMPRPRKSLYGTFGGGKRFKHRKSITCDVKYYCNPYGYPFESHYKRFSKP